MYDIFDSYCCGLHYLVLHALVPLKLYYTSEVK